MLTSKVRVILPDNDCPSVEDIFSSGMDITFTDHVRDQHGDPGATIIYKSNDFGELELTVSDPKNENDRQLFAQYLWNAGVLVTQKIEHGEAPWNVSALRVLELGAGLGLPGIISCLKDAHEVVVSDYPSTEALANLTRNIEKNVPPASRNRIRVEPHEWGECSDRLADRAAHSFDRVIAADCLWMPWQHENLALSMLHFLAESEAAYVLVVAGFHTGRARLVPFFETATRKSLEVDSIHEEDIDGNVREWVTERPEEDVTSRRRWMVVAVLKRAQRVPG